ncbi:MAG: glycosyltransferase family 4 protein [Patescibacteria group bacterium]
MKLLFITEYFPATTEVEVHGGVEVRTYNIAKRLAKRHSVTVISSLEFGKPRKQILNRIVVKRVGGIRRYSSFGKHTSIFSRFIFVIYSVWEGLNVDFDLVEGTGYMGWIPAWIVGVVKHKKKVAWIADLTEFTFKPYLSNWSIVVIQLIERLILKLKWDALVCISNTVCKKVQRLGVPSERINVIYCGTDVNKIQRLHVEKNHQEIVCVARLVKYKRIEDLITALQKVKLRIPSVKLSIIGVGGELKFLKNIVANLNLRKQVQFKGFIPKHRDVWRLIKQARVLCVPSEIEGFGITTIEAMAAGVPVVAADLPINREITKNKGVLFFKSKNTVDLANQLTTLLVNQEIYHRLIRQSGFVIRNYDWKKLSKQTQELYENLCSY